MYYFILHLSLADLLTAFFTLLPEVLWTITLPEFFLEGDLMCRAVKYMQMVGPYLSSYVLIMTAIDRYQVRSFFFSYLYESVNSYERTWQKLSCSHTWELAYGSVYSHSDFFLHPLYLRGLH